MVKIKVQAPPMHRATEETAPQVEAAESAPAPPIVWKLIVRAGPQHDMNVVVGAIEAALAGAEDVVLNTDCPRWQLQGEDGWACSGTATSTTAIEAVAQAVAGKIAPAMIDLIAGSALTVAVSEGDVEDPALAILNASVPKIAAYVEGVTNLAHLYLLDDTEAAGANRKGALRAISARIAIVEAELERAVAAEETSAPSPEAATKTETEVRIEGPSTVDFVPGKPATIVALSRRGRDVFGISREIAAQDVGWWNARAFAVAPGPHELRVVGLSPSQARACAVADLHGTTIWTDA